MKKDRYSYIALFNYDEDGISIHFPDFPGCLPSAAKDDTPAAIANSKDALGLQIFGMEQDGEELPNPTKITEIKITENQIPVIIDVFMPSVRARAKQRFVKKTLSLPAWLAAAADRDGVNCSKVFQDALMDYLGI